ncbi:MAG TPA: hypothetical protein PKN32_04715 [Bacteroidales bacterium]|nr:hypothetical protein [Bacteroidales bacterium]
MSKTFFIDILFVCIFLFFGCTKEEEKRFILQASENRIVEIFNLGEKTAKFKMVIDGKDLNNEDNIVLYVKNMKDQYENEPLEMKAFRFVCDFTWHDELVTRHNWAYSPYVMLNSLGGGLCGFRSAVLTNILIKLGFKARSWCLEGHVVTEVYSDGKWKMLDPDYGVYYYNRKNEIASFDELCADASLITNPLIKVVDNDEYNYIYVYSGRMAKLYSSIDDNSLFNVDYDEMFENVELYFELPPGAVFSFPFNKKYAGNFYAYAELSIPAGYVGKISIPLIVAGMKGSSVVKYLENEYCANEFEVQTIINKNTEVSFEYDIIDNPKGMKIYYYINPLVFMTYGKTEFVLSGKNIGDVEIKNSDRTDIQFTLPYQNTYLYNRLDSLLSDFIIDSDLTEISLDSVFLKNYFDIILEVMTNDDELPIYFDLNSFRLDLDSLAKSFRQDSITDYSGYFSRDNTIKSISKILNNHIKNLDFF